MATHINTISDGTIIEFDKGKFDEWCVFITQNNISRFAPADLTYFRELKELGLKYGHINIYNDFLKIYTLTFAKIDKNVLLEIKNISEKYIQDKFKLELWFTVIYAGMIAEENKKFAVLKKRIKRLGMYQLLVEDKSAEYAANFSKGKKWQELDLIMKRLSF